MTKLKLHLSLLLGSGILAISACDKLSDGNELAAVKGYEYPGISKLNLNDDGTNTLVWEAAPLEGVTYSLYKKVGKESFRWNEPPFKTLSQTSFQTDDLRFEAKTCFAVRASSQAYTNDKNEKQVCTPGNTFKFAGLESLERGEASRWMAKWEKVPHEGVKYQIFESDPSGGIAAKPLREVSENFTEIGPFPIGEVKCFVVRFVVASKPNVDVNTTQKCSDANRIGGFSGIEKAESRATGKVIVSWSAADHPDVAGYVVYRGADFKESVATVNLKQVTNVTLSDLNPGEKMTFGVRAISKDGSEDKNTRSLGVQVLDLRPLAFGGILGATITGKNEALVQWPEISGAKEFRIYVASGEVGSTPAFNWSVPAATLPASQGNSYRLSGLGDEMRHRIAVRSVSAFDVEDSNVLSFDLDFPDQGPPTFKGLKSAKIVNGKVELLWDKALGNVDKYIVYRVKGPASALDYSMTNPGLEPGSVNSTLVSGFQANQSYSFAVRARDRNGQIEQNSVALTITVGTQSLPEFVGYQSGQGINETSLRVRFLVTSSGNVSRYLGKIRKRGLSAWSAGTQVVAQDVTKSSLELVFPDLLAKTEYEILIQAEDLWGNSSSNETVFRVSTLDLTPPTFSGVQNAQQATGSPEVVVSWQPRPTADIDQYRVFWSTSPLSNQTLSSKTALPTGVFMSGRVDGALSQLKFTALTKGTTYYFLVRALDLAENEELNTAQASTTVLNSFPSLVADVSSVRSPEMTSSQTINLRAQDVDAGDVLTITRMSTTCSASFARPVLVSLGQNGKIADATVNWMPDAGYIDSNTDEKICTEVYQASDGQSSSPVVTLTFAAFDRAPRNVVSTITPQSGGFKRSRNLVCTGTGDDDDGNPLTWTYQWWKNGAALAGATSATLTPAAGAFAPGDTFECRASANDDHLTVTARSVLVTFGNEAPVLGSVSILEDGGSAPFVVTDRVACTFNASDADGDPITFGAVSVESSPNGTDQWIEEALDPVTCGIVQNTRRCFTVSTAVRRRTLRCKLASAGDGFVVNNVAKVSTSVMTVGNSSPTIASVSTNPPGALETGTQLACVPAINDIDGDSLSPALIQWTREQVAIPGATSNTYTLVPADRNTSIRCEVSLAANADGFGSAARGPVASPPRSYSNSNPSVTDVRVTPTTGVVTNTTLTCTPTVTDPDNDPVNLSNPFGIYSWTSNDGSGEQVIPGQTGSTLLVTASQRGFTLKCYFALAANADGQNSIAIAAQGSANAVQPFNSPPVISNVSVSAAATPAITNTVLTCNRTIVDPDSDNIVEQPRYTWKANGTNIPSQTNQTYALKKTDRTKNVTCAVSLPANSDGKITPPVAEVISSNSIVSVNSQPEIAQVTVISETSPPYYPGTVFTCRVDAINDADGDTPTGPFAWFADGAELPGQTSLFYTSNNLARDKNISCELRLSANADGFGSTPTSRASGNFATVANRAPVSNYQAIAEKVGGGSAYKDSVLNCRLPVLNPPDPDEDPTTTKFVWRRGGALYPGYTVAGIANSQLDLSGDVDLAPGVTMTCQTVLSDGLASSLSQESVALVIVNRAPVFPSGSTVRVSPSEAFASPTTNTLTCGGSVATDGDGETLTYTTDWIYKRLSDLTWTRLKDDQTGLTLTANGPLQWTKDIEIGCQIQATDPSGSTARTPYITNSGQNGITVIGATVVNSSPVGNLICNGGSQSVSGFAGQPFAATSSCLASGTTFADGDGDGANFTFDPSTTLTTCAGLGSQIIMDSGTGSISGYMPGAPCQVTIQVTDESGVQLKNAGGTVQKFTINFALPFISEIGLPALDATCKLEVPTKFVGGTVAYGSSTYAVTGVAQDPKAHTSPNSASGKISASINPAGGGGPVLLTWTIVGNPASTTQVLSRSLMIVDSASTGSVPTSPVPQPGLQPTPVPDMTGLRAEGCSLADCTGRQGSISAGLAHSCAVSASSDLYCWGENLYGEIGDGTNSTPTNPEAIKVNLGTSKVRSVSAGGMQNKGVSHTCAILEHGTTSANQGVWCWGDNSYAQLGRGNINPTVTLATATPQQVTNLPGGTGSNEIVAVSAGGAHTCVLSKESSALSGSGVKCWGANELGQLGNGTQQVSAVPENVVGYGSAGAKSIVTGGNHTCVVTAVGTAACWGQNKDNQLGIDNPAVGDKFSTFPVTVPNLNNVVDLAAGDSHTCALLSNGDVKCWGGNLQGQLGIGEQGSSSSAIRPFFGSVVEGKKAISIAAAGQSTCALLIDGSVKCWGANSFGQLGDNDTISQAAPVEVQNLSKAALSIEMGNGHTCILKNTGGVSCFGAYAALGLQTAQKRPINNAMPQSSIMPPLPAARFQNCRVLRAVDQ